MKKKFTLRKQNSWVQRRLPEDTTERRIHGDPILRGTEQVALPPWTQQPPRWATHPSSEGPSEVGETGPWADSALPPPPSLSRCHLLQSSDRQHVHHTPVFQAQNFQGLQDPVESEKPSRPRLVQRRQEDSLGCPADGVQAVEVLFTSRQAEV